ncbi:MAG: hypothetical protein ACOCP8_08085 [archaeon]
MKNNENNKEKINKIVRKNISIAIGFTLIMIGGITKYTSLTFSESMIFWGIIVIIGELLLGRG